MLPGFQLLGQQTSQGNAPNLGEGQSQHSGCNVKDVVVDQTEDLAEAAVCMDSGSRDSSAVV